VELNDYVNQVEALVFASEKGISIGEIKLVLSEITLEPTEKEIQDCIEKIRSRYQDSTYSIELVELNGGYQFLTKKEFYPIVKLLQLQRSKKALSQSALETLAIIAYKQPVTKLDVEQIRGVNCDYSIQKLLDKELIVITGRSDAVGKPILYSVSGMFMDYFGINSSADLPKLKDLVPDSNEIGTQAE
jgi:segregation and condensation protein B